MEPPVLFYDRSNFSETLTGNKISKKSFLCGSQKIRLGKTIVQPGSCIRGDLASVNIGVYSVVGKNSIIRPPYKNFKGGIAFFPLTIGDYVTVGDDTVVEAASIGSFVNIGKNCIIGRSSILYNGCQILDNTILPPDTVVPPFTVFAGFPGLLVGELPESYQLVQKDYATTFYNNFQPNPPPVTRT